MDIRKFVLCYMIAIGVAFITIGSASLCKIDLQRIKDHLFQPILLLLSLLFTEFSLSLEAFVTFSLKDSLVCRYTKPFHFFIIGFLSKDGFLQISTLNHR